VAQNSVQVLASPKHLTRETLDAFKAEVDRFIDADGPGVVFDMAGTEFLNSTGLGYIVNVGKTLSERGRRLALARPTPAVERLIRMVGLDEMLNLRRTLEDATAYVQDGG
jgi:anti-sigma B factor antagonist